MEVRINEFRIDTALPVEAPLDFTALCAILAQHQAATPTARLARGENGPVEHSDHAHPAIAVLRAGHGETPVSAGAHGSFHAAAAAVFSDRSR